jgi:hypothetical protein
MSITLNGTTGITTPALDTSGDVTFADNDKAVFGAGSDLQIYHIADTGNLIQGQSTYGNIDIMSHSTRILDNGSNVMADFSTSGSSSRLFNGADGLKLATTATGINVTGDITPTGGVYLGGTGSANYLDDYEEGTWTPTISSGTVTYSAQRGRYTKIGRMVYVHCFISIASISGSSDTNIISGLPFVSKNDSNYPALASKTNGFDWGGARTMITFQVTPNSINISAVASGNNQTFLDVNTAGLAATDWIACTGHYVTDA